MATTDQSNTAPAEIQHPATTAALAPAARKPATTRAARAKAQAGPRVETTPAKAKAAAQLVAVPVLTTARVLSTTNPQDMLYLAQDLAKFVKDNNLASAVQGKSYVNVEGWQYAGSRLGLTPIVANVLNCSTEAEIKYQASVTIWDMVGQQTVGAGFAICSNKESGRKFYQEFAIASMAQTRAVGKAYRNILAWIMRAAGYEPTPAEEMDYQGNQPSPATPAPVAPAPAPAAPLQAAHNPAADLRQLPATGQEGQPVDPAEPAQVYASQEQKQHIIRLLNHPVITRQEKTKMMLSINRLTVERAAEAIAKLDKAITDREGSTEAVA